MLRTLDRGCALVLGLGAGLGHSAGSLAAYAHQPFTLLWALNASVLGVTLAALHGLRASRPWDRALAWLLVPPTLAWIVFCPAFGVLLRNVADPRVLVFVLASIGLVCFSLAPATRSAPVQ